MPIHRRAVLAAAASAAIAPRFAQAPTPTIRIGIERSIRHLSRRWRADRRVCAKQAPLDFGISGKGWNVEIIAADHQNKPDVGASIARQWFDQGGVDAIVDVPTSSARLAVSTVCRERTRSC